MRSLACHARSKVLFALGCLAQVLCAGLQSAVGFQVEGCVVLANDAGGPVRGLATPLQVDGRGLDDKAI